MSIGLVCEWLSCSEGLQDDWVLWGVVVVLVTGRGVGACGKRGPHTEPPFGGRGGHREIVGLFFVKWETRRLFGHGSVDFAICLEWSVPKSGAGVVLKRAYGARVGLSKYARAGPADAGGLSFGVNDPGDKPNLPRIFHVASRESLRCGHGLGHAGDRLDRYTVPVTHRNRGGQGTLWLGDTATQRY